MTCGTNDTWDYRADPDVNLREPHEIVANRVYKLHPIFASLLANPSKSINLRSNEQHVIHSINSPFCTVIDVILTAQ